ncbi:MAG: class I SAM-dependent rRNA methyltransferase [Labilithrix sp.]|nr:class I SAM-dependent rRNA methyltransferase [Labilithrix sp.]MCW5816270.1 class I SAM-dependent rRNA methyltransferase [Labilithrix sp.]
MHGGAADSVRRGHPWIYASATAHLSNGPASIVRIVDEDGHFLGSGIWDPGSPIAVRVWTRNPTEDVNARLFRARLEAALAIRTELFADGATTAYRLLNGEGDRTPGFVIDRYADVAVLKIDGDAARALADTLLADVEAPLRAAGITTFLDRRGKKGEPPTLRARFGELPRTGKVEVKEHGVPFVVDLAKGQKTGAFLDQRENRRRIAELVTRKQAPRIDELGAQTGRTGQSETERTLGPRVLNLFSYTGGFSLRAALAGGVVTSVDVAMGAHATAQESFRLAGVDPKGHAFVTADCFAFLEAAWKRGETWDVVISDPPSFAPSEKAKPKGLAAYRSLHHACVRVLAPGGTFVAASCSSHVGLEEFVATLDDAALGRSDLRLLETFGPPPDHPTLPSFPEGRYLKLAILA